MKPLRVLVFGLAFPAAACAAEAGVFSVWNRPPAARAAERKIWDEELADFSATYARTIGEPTFKVNAVSREYVAQQFVPVMAGGKGPDVAKVRAEALPSLARQGLLASLKSEVDGWDQRAFVPQVFWDAATVEGKIYGVPCDSYVTVLMVRKDLWVQAGYSIDQPPADWAALEAAAKRLNDPARGVAGFGFSPTIEAVGDFVRQAGGELFRGGPAGWEPSFQENPGTAALTYLRRLRFEDGVLQSDPLASREELAQLFALGRLAMMMGVPDQMPDLISRYGMDPGELLLFPLPAGPTGVHAAHAGGEYFVVNASATPRNKAAAWAYIRTQLSPGNQLYRWRRMNELGLPIFPGAFSTTAHLSQLPGFQLMEQALSSARPEPALPKWPQIKDDLESGVLELLFTQADADVSGELREAAERVRELYL
jgi:ABC-type glycerol-3-phosphate transport system substrate-binding protein